MKKLIVSNIVTLISMGFLFSCKTQTSSIAVFHHQEVECLDNRHDGSQILRSCGLGKYKSDAIEQAKKNAIRTIIFRGFPTGMGECNMRPLVNEANAEEKYEEYFSNFFKNNGLYNNYINITNRKLISKSKSANTVSYAITVRVLRKELKERLLKDKILTK